MFTKKRSARILTVAGATALALGGISGTQAATDNIAVTATVVANCAIAAGALDLGSYDPVVVNASTDALATSTITVTCTSGASATVTLGQGTTVGAGSTDADPNRRLTDGANFLNYGLFTDVGRSVEWGNTAGTGVAHTGTGAGVPLTVYGNIPAGQNVPAGAYAGTVIATITL
jgi:spore coat protein U-like protein